MQSADAHGQSGGHHFHRLSLVPGGTQLMEIASACSGNLHVADVRPYFRITQYSEVHQQWCETVCRNQIFDECKLRAFGIERTGNDNCSGHISATSLLPVTDRVGQPPSGSTSTELS